jgi:hypothetical protein
MTDLPQSTVQKAEAMLAARDLGRALYCFQQAQETGADPDGCAAGRWMIHMLQGDFEAAWKESDAIRKRGQPDPHRLWQGESLHGQRVILRCLHGFGDAVQFLRYVPQLQAVAQSVIVEVNPRFVDLARCFKGIEHVITWGDSAPAEPVPWDVQIEIMELPYLFRTQLNELPLRERYLHLPGIARTEAQHSEAPQIGLVWTAGEWAPERSIPFSTLRPLLEVRGCDFWNLEATSESDTREEIASMRHAPGSQDSIVCLAETIAKLDLVITVDTLAAHLAGALGVPCFVLLQHAADWRWMHERPDSPWYPSLRLFRQQVTGDWSSVITSAHDALQQFEANQ